MAKRRRRQEKVGSGDLTPSRPAPALPPLLSGTPPQLHAGPPPLCLRGWNGLGCRDSWKLHHPVLNLSSVYTSANGPLVQPLLRLPPERQPLPTGPRLTRSRVRTRRLSCRGHQQRQAQPPGREEREGREKPADEAGCGEQARWRRDLAGQGAQRRPRSIGSQPRQEPPAARHAGCEQEDRQGLERRAQTQSRTKALGLHPEAAGRLQMPVTR